MNENDLDDLLKISLADVKLIIRQCITDIVN